MESMPGRLKEQKRGHCGWNTVGKNDNGGIIRGHILWGLIKNCKDFDFYTIPMKQHSLKGEGAVATMFERKHCRSLRQL